MLSEDPAVTSKWEFLESYGYRESTRWTLSTSCESLPAVTPLPHLGAWTLAGNGAREFLQGYVTSDLDETQPGSLYPTAFCNLKGRVLATALVSAKADEVTLVMREEMIDPVLASLKKYLAFARGCKLVHEQVNIFGCVGHLPANTEDCPLSFASEQPLRLVHSTQDEAERKWKELCTLAAPADARLWAWHELTAGFVHVSEQTSEEFLPQMIGLEELGGVSYTKGCYLGQEIVTRAAHRGKVKRHLVRTQWEASDNTEPDIGTKLVNEQGREVGMLVASAPYPDEPATFRGLAVVSGEPDGELRIEGHPAGLRAVINFC